MRTIDISDLTNAGQVRNLAGHERGLQAREHFDMDGIDAGDQPVRVIVPRAIYLLSPAFLQGFLAPSVRRLGGREQFLERYLFDCSDEILQQIESAIDASLIVRGSLLS